MFESVKDSGVLCVCWVMLSNKFMAIFNTSFPSFVKNQHFWELTFVIIVQMLFTEQWTSIESILAVVCTRKPSWRKYNTSANIKAHSEKFTANQPYVIT